MSNYRHLGIAEGNDFHRRRNDAKVQTALIAREKQNELNKKEWLKRAKKALDANDFCLAERLIEQARFYDR